MTRSFALTWDYRCPFARNAHEAAVAGIRSGKGWTVQFRAFSLDQAHAADGASAQWELPPDSRGSGVLALQWGIAVRDTFPERFLDFHVAVFAARFDHGRHLEDEQVLRDVARAQGLEADLVAKEVSSERPLARLAVEHSEGSDQWRAFGVPTIVADSESAFVRLMERGRSDDLERVLDLLAWSNLNELKRTTISR